MLYKFLKYLFRLILFFLAKVEVKNIDRIPIQDPVLLACNHLSFWDPVILGVFLPRKLHFMAKEELFKIFLVGSVIRRVGTFPVKRGAADRNAIRESIKILKEGKVLCIFPEGTRSKTGELLDFQPGITLIAQKGSASIIPIGIKGTNKILSSIIPAKIQVNIGEPLYLDKIYGNKLSGEQLEKATELLHEKVKDLLTP
ncbi:MAG: 1-acyl-sn-glycerol-3-phosphate acyltransferase [Clostridia bacterium]|nr:1-acyl-sn-glycerol-3-phosphate acyltransferase [Clostridia bacterium]MDN5322888.1 1-acyl-sn-glycerol-3-phosphate acyltransferase [Clostridia bacterium]